MLDIALSVRDGESMYTLHFFFLLRIYAILYRWYKISQAEFSCREEEEEKEERAREE